MFNATSHISKWSPAICADLVHSSTPLTLENTQHLRAASRAAQCCRNRHCKKISGHTMLQENIWAHTPHRQQNKYFNSKMTHAADLETQHKSLCRKFLCTQPFLSTHNAHKHFLTHTMHTNTSQHTQCT